MTSRLVYLGASRVRRGASVAAFVTVGGSNVKTGAGTVQVHILDAETDPVTAYQSGTPGNCPTECQHLQDGTCYVRYEQAPLGIWKAWNRGNVAPLPRAGIGDYLQRAADRGYTLLRFGASGDPAALPAALVRVLADAADAAGMDRTAYTHAWQRASARHLQAYAMASVDDVDAQARAALAGWRTFRASTFAGDDVPAVGEVRCPASAERGALLTCATCKVCNGGTPATDAPSVVLRLHGIHAPDWEV